MVGSYGSKITNTYAYHLTALTANTTAEKANMVLTGTEIGDFTDADSAATCLHYVESNVETIGGKVVTVKNVRIQKVNNNYNYLTLSDGTGGTAPKTVAAVKTLKFGLYYCNDFLGAFSTDKVYNVTFIIYDASKAVSSANDNTIFRGLAPQITEVVA